MAKDNVSSRQNSVFFRYLHLMTLVYVFELASTKESEKAVFSKPVFDLFKEIPNKFRDMKDKYRLFKNIMYKFKWKFMAGFIVTLVYASLNLKLSLIIKEFIEVLQDGKSTRSSSQVTFIFIFLQMARMVFGTNMKQIFMELAIQIESTLSSKLVEKALIIDPLVRSRLPESESYQLQNVDLKLIHTLFSVLYLSCEIPYTIIIALVLLFQMNYTLGMIAAYWFLIVFIFQRYLDDHMKQCNITKLGLIQKRSKINYEFMQKIREARITHTQSLMIEKNNDLFLEECHDHHAFYRYSSLYDIAQLLLPIGVIMTALFFNQNSNTPITVEELYVIISILGICYGPMKDCRTISIAWSDGMHSIRRLTDYLQLPQEKDDQIHYRSCCSVQPFFVIKKGTTGTVRSRGGKFSLLVNQHIEVKSGERMIVVGRKREGSSTLMQMIAGCVQLTSGRIEVHGKISYLSQQNQILVDTLYKNLIFYDKTITKEEASQVCYDLEIFQELCATDGLDENIQPNKYDEGQLRLLSLARIFCSKSSVYVLDSPFVGLTIDSQNRVEKLLKKKQKEGAVIIIALKIFEDIVEDDCWMVILKNGTTKQVGRFRDMRTQKSSYLEPFLKAPKVPEQKNQKNKYTSRLIIQFQSKIRKCMMFSALFQSQSKLRQTRQKVSFLMKIVSSYSSKLLKNQKQIKKDEESQITFANIYKYILKFLSSCPVSESAFVLVIIIAVEVLHIFIHFYIGHEYEHSAHSGLSAISNLMMYELVLTLGLAGLIYLEGEVSSYLSIIAGNKLYKESLESLLHKQIEWYGEEYYLRTADRFNHDYQQIFMFVHAFLTLYKNVVILIATALFIGSSHNIVLLVTICISFLYFLIWEVLKRANKCILKYYYDYKYEFVKVFGESIEVAELIKIHGVREQVLAKAQDKYTRLASYKIAANKIVLGQALLCNLVSLVVTSLSLRFGSTVVGDKLSISALATSIMLLLNLADVLKAILDAAVKIQAFFRLNILPFMIIAPISSNRQSYSYQNSTGKYDIQIKNLIMKESSEQIFEVYPLNLTIPEGQRICIYEADGTLRNNLLYGLTRNLSFVSDQTKLTSNIFLGGVPLCKLSSENVCNLIGVIMDQNFFISGTLEENLKWRCLDFDEQLAYQLAKKVGIGNDISSFHAVGLKATIQDQDEEISEGLSKKLAVVRIILHQPKIVIIMDTPAFVGNWSIVQLLNKYNPGCTIIKITNSMNMACDMQRVVLLDHMQVIEQGDPKVLADDRLSRIGEMIGHCNYDAYLYRNKAHSTNYLSHHKKEYVKKSMLLKTMKGKL